MVGEAGENGADWNEGFVEKKLSFVSRPDPPEPWARAGEGANCGDK